MAILTWRDLGETMKHVYMWFFLWKVTSRRSEIKLISRHDKNSDHALYFISDFNPQFLSLSLLLPLFPCLLPHFPRLDKKKTNMGEKKSFLIDWERGSEHGGRRMGLLSLLDVNFFRIFFSLSYYEAEEFKLCSISRADTTCFGCSILY